jgi:hypothetical protein
MENARTAFFRKSQVVRREIDGSLEEEQQQIISDIRQSEIEHDHFKFEAQINPTEEESMASQVQNEKSLGFDEKNYLIESSISDSTGVNFRGTS